MSYVNVPTDFDPQAYIYLNPEIEIDANIDTPEKAITHYVSTGSSQNLSYNYDNIPENFNAKIFMLDTDDLQDDGTFDTYLAPVYQAQIDETRIGYVVYDRANSTIRERLHDYSVNYNVDLYKLIYPDARTLDPENAFIQYAKSRSTDNPRLGDASEMLIDSQFLGLFVNNMTVKNEFTTDTLTIGLTENGGNPYSVDKISNDSNLGGINFSGGETTLPTMKAVKTYVDNIAQGIRIKEGVEVATSTEYVNVSYSTVFDDTLQKNIYTLQINETTNNQINGVSVSLNDRVLIKDQNTNKSQNGIYYVIQSEDTGLSQALTLQRTPDADDDNEIMNGMYTFDKHNKIGYVCINEQTVTLSTAEDINFKGYLYVNLDSNLEVEGLTVRTNLTTSNFTGTGTQLLQGATTISGDLTVNSTNAIFNSTTLTVNSPLDLSNNLTATGNISNAGTITTEDTATFGSNVTINGASILQGSLNVAQATTLQSNLDVIGYIDTDTLIIDQHATAPLYNIISDSNQKIIFKDDLNSYDYTIQTDNVSKNLQIFNSLTNTLTIQQSNSYVGINNPNPAYQLDITGDVRASGSLISSVATGITPLHVTSTTKVQNLNVDMLDDQTGDFYTNMNNTNAGILAVQYGGQGNNTLSSNKLLIGQGTDPVLQPTELHWDDTNKRLGINTATPQNTVDINGTTTIRDTLSTVSTNPQIKVSPTVSGEPTEISFHQNDDQSGVKWSIGQNVHSVGQSNFSVGNDTANSALTILHDGKVGINETVPTHTLQVQGTQYNTEQIKLTDTILIAPTTTDQATTTKYYTSNDFTGESFNVGRNNFSSGKEVFGIGNSLNAENAVSINDTHNVAIGSNVPNTNEDILIIKHPDTSSNTSIKLLSSATSNNATFSLWNDEDVTGTVIKQTDDLTIETTSNGISTIKATFINTPTGDIEFHNQTNAGTLKNWGDIQSTQTISAHLFSGDGSNLTNTTHYYKDTTTDIGKGNALNLEAGSNIVLTTSSNNQQIDYLIDAQCSLYTYEKFTEPLFSTAILHFPFSEQNSTTIIHDHTRTENNATIQATSTVENNKYTNPPTFEGITFNNPVVLLSKKTSIVGYISLNSSQTNQYNELFGKVLIQDSVSGNLGYDDGTQFVAFSPTVQLTPDAENHIVYYQDDTTMKLYINQNLVHTNNTYITTNIETIFTNSEGTVSEFVIWNRELTTDEIGLLGNRKLNHKYYYDPAKQRYGIGTISPADGYSVDIRGDTQIVANSVDINAPTSGDTIQLSLNNDNQDLQIQLDTTTTTISMSNGLTNPTLEISDGQYTFKNNNQGHTIITQIGDTSIGHSNSPTATIDANGDLLIRSTTKGLSEQTVKGLYQLFDGNTDQAWIQSIDRSQLSNVDFPLKISAQWVNFTDETSTNAVKVGFGVNNPTETVEVSGTVKATTLQGSGSKLYDLNYLSYQASSDISSSPILLYNYKPQQNGYTQINDLTDNSNHSTTTYNLGTYTTTIDALYGTCLQFTEQNKSSFILNSTISNSNATFNIVYQPSSFNTGSLNTILSDSSGTLKLLAIDETSKLLQTIDGVSTNTISGYQFQTSKWYNITLTVSNDTDLTYYINGKNMGSYSLVNTTLSANSIKYIGSGNDTETALGKFGEISVFDYVFSSQQVQKLFQTKTNHEHQIVVYDTPSQNHRTEFEEIKTDQLIVFSSNGYSNEYPSFLRQTATEQLLINTLNETRIVGQELKLSTYSSAIGDITTPDAVSSATEPKTHFHINSNGKTVLGQTGTHLFSDDFEVYPTIDGDSTYNSRISFLLNDTSSNLGKTSINLHQTGGQQNEGQINFFCYSDREGGVSSQIASVDKDFSSYLSFRTAETGNNGSNQAVERMVIGTNGNVGVNVSDPQFTIDCHGDLNYTGTLMYNGSPAQFGTKLNTTPNGLIPFGQNDDVLTSNALFFWDDTNNRLGVNTNTPSHTLTVEGSQLVSSNLLIGTVPTTIYSDIHVTNTTASKSSIALSSAVDTKPQIQLLTFGTGSNRLYFNAFESNDTIFNSSDSNKYSYILEQNDNLFSFKTGKPLSGSNTFTTTTLPLVIDAAGKVAINRNAPTSGYNLDVNGNAFIEGNISADGNIICQLASVTQLNNNIGETLYINSNSSEDVIVSLNSSSKVGFGTTLPNYKIDVSGDINFTGNLYKNGVSYPQILDQLYEEGNFYIIKETLNEATLREGELSSPASYTQGNGYIQLTSGTTSENGYVQWKRRLGKTFVSSFDIWFNQNTTEGFYYAFFKPVAGAVEQKETLIYDYMKLSINQGEIAVFTPNAKSYTLSTKFNLSTPLTTSTWHNLKVIYDFGKMDIYVNDELIGSTTNEIFIGDMYDELGQYVTIGGQNSSSSSILRVKNFIVSQNCKISTGLDVAQGGTGTFTIPKDKLLVGNNSDPVYTDDDLHWDNTNKRLAIGTTTPSKRLHLYGTGGTNEQQIAFGNGVLGNNIFYAGLNINNEAIIGTNYSGNINFATNDTNCMTINSNGNIVIGKTGTQTFSEILEIYPNIDGTSTGNSKISFDIIDDASTGTASINLYQPGGAGNEGQLNFFSYSGRPAGVSSQIVSVGSNNSSYLVFRTAEDGNSGSNAVQDRMTILTTGQVGINTVTPSYTLDVAGDINFTGNLKSNGVNFTAQEPVGQIVYGSGTGIQSESVLFWDATNNRLGVNDATPQYTIDATGDINTTGTYKQSGSDLISFGTTTKLTNGYSFYNGSANSCYLGLYNNTITTGSLNTLYLYTSTSNGGLINNLSGNTVIGNSNGGLLQLQNNSDTNVEFTLPTSATSSWLFKKGTVEQLKINDGIYSDMPCYFTGNGQQFFLIDNPIYVPSTPQGKLTIGGYYLNQPSTKNSIAIHTSHGDINYPNIQLRSSYKYVNTINFNCFMGSNNTYYHSDASYSAWQIQHYADSFNIRSFLASSIDGADITANANSVLTCFKNGQTTAGSGTFYSAYVLTADGDFQVTGEAYKPGGGSFVATSDIRSKKNISQYNEHGLKQILQLEPVRYDYNGLYEKETNNQKHIGLIAQQVEQILPECVFENSTQNHKTDQMETIKKLDTTPLTFTMINAFKELNSTTEQHSKQLEDLQNTVLQLQKQIDNLKNSTNQ